MGAEEWETVGSDAIAASASASASRQLPTCMARGCRGWGLREPVTWLALCIVVLAAVIRVITLGAPFKDISEGTGAYYGTLGRNYLIDNRSRVVPIQSEGLDENVPPRFYDHHPPLVPLSIAGSYLLLGEGEWQTRLPTALCTVGTAGLLLVIFGRQDRRVGLLAAGIWAALPMTTYYGGMPDIISPQLLLFVLLTVAAYVNFSERPSPRSLAWVCLAFLPAGLVDWPAFYLLPIVLVAFAVSHPWRQWHWIILFCCWGTLLFGTINIHYALTTHREWFWIVSLFSGRSVGGVSDTWGNWLAKGWDYLSEYATFPVIVMSLLGAVRLFRGREKTTAGSVARILVIWSVVHVIVGKQGCTIHPWWWWPMMLSLVLMAAFGIVDLAERAGAAGQKVMVVSAAAIGCLLVWGCWQELPRLLSADATYSRELAAAIRHVAPGRNDAVVLVASVEHPPLWYYAHRPIKSDVWSVKGFQEAMTSHQANLSWGFFQPWPYAPRAVVVPPSSVGAAQELVKYLAEHYRSVPASAGLEDYRFFSLDEKIR